MKKKNIESLLEEYFVELPEPYTRPNGLSASKKMGKYLHVKGVLPYLDGKLFAKGKIGAFVSVDQAAKAARSAFLQALAVVKYQSEFELNDIKSIVFVDAYLVATETFAEHYKVLSNVSDFVAKLFGPKATYASTCIAVESLPEQVAVMLDVVFEVK